MGQTIFESCEYDLEAATEPTRNLMPCYYQESARQKHKVAQTLKRIGDGVEERYFRGNANFHFVYDFRLNRDFGIFLVGICGVILLKNFLS